MFKTKQQIDKHVSAVYGSIKDERERNNRGFQFAKMYFDIKEYDCAQRYVSAFLSQRETFSPAHRLMGDIMEQKGNFKGALSAYKKSLQLDDSQIDVILKVCELLCKSSDVSADQAKFWAEKAESVAPNSEVIYKLKEVMIRNMRDGSSGDGAASGNSDVEDLEELLTAELVKRPRDYKLRTSLLQLFLKKQRVTDAYTHATLVEKMLPHTRCMTWYRCVLDVLQAFQGYSGARIESEFYQFMLHVLNELVHLTTEGAESARLTDSVHYLYQLDQCVYRAENKIASQSDVGRVYIQEMQGQLFYHAGTLLLKKAQLDRVSWGEASQISAACYLCSVALKPPTLQAAWYVQAPDEDKKLLHHLYQMSCLRWSQSGHMANNLCIMPGKQWLQRVQEDIMTTATKEKLHSLLFTNREMKETRETSFLLRNSLFTSFKLELPSEEMLWENDEVAHLVYPNHLHRLVWLALQRYSAKDEVQPNYMFQVFSDLHYCVPKLDAPSPESMCQLDGEVFLYACVRIAALRKHQDSLKQLQQPSQPSMMPLALCKGLVSREQMEWWEAACEMQQTKSTNNPSDYRGSRLTVQRGLEVLRLMGNHGQPVRLVAHLARTLQERLVETQASEDLTMMVKQLTSGLEAYTQLYWQGLVDLVKRYIRGQQPGIPKNRFFGDNLEEVPDDVELLALQEEASYQLALLHKQKGEHSDALRLLEGVSYPEASFQQAMIYKRLADLDLAEYSLPQLGAEDQGKQLSLRSKIRDCLYNTLDRLRSSKHSDIDLTDDIDLVESQVAQLEELGAMSEESSEDLMKYRCARYARYSQMDIEDAEGHMIISDGDLAGFDNDFDESDGENLLNGQNGYSENSIMKPSSYSQNWSSGAQNVSSTPRRRPGRPPTGLKTCLQDQLIAMSTPKSVTRSHGLSYPTSAPQVTPPSHRRVRPSPERLEAQMNAFKNNQEQVVRTLLEELREQRLMVQGYQEKLHTAEAEKLKLEQEKLTLIQRAYEAERDRDEERRHSEFSTSRLEDDKSRMEEGKKKLDHERASSLSRHSTRHEEDRRKFDEMQRQHQAAYEMKFNELLRKQEHYQKELKEVQHKMDESRQKVEEQKQALEQDRAKLREEMRGLDDQRARMDQERLRFEEMREKLDSERKRVDEEKAKLQEERGRLAVERELVERMKEYNLNGIEDDRLYDHSDDDDDDDDSDTNQHQMNAAAYNLASLSVPATQALPATHTMPKAGFFSSLGSKPAVPVATTAEEDKLTGLKVTGSSTLKELLAGAPSAAAAESLKKDSPQKPKDSGDGRKSSENRRESTGDDYGSGDEGAPDPQFEPLVTLPEVEVKTGEEDESVMFEARSKLYRFTEGQWKERGVGMMKILFNPETNKARVLMRRDQVHKVCANHNVRSNIQIDYKEDSKDRNVLTWRATDFSDDEPRLEQFACKFKTAEIAAEFLAEFKKAQLYVPSDDSLVARSATSAENMSSSEALFRQASDTGRYDGHRSVDLEASFNFEAATTMTPPQRFSSENLRTPPHTHHSPSLYKPDKGQWICLNCDLRMASSKHECTACGTIRPSEKSSMSSSSEMQSASTTFLDGAGAFSVPYAQASERLASSVSPGSAVDLRMQPAASVSSASSTENKSFPLSSNNKLFTDYTTASESNTDDEGRSASASANSSSLSLFGNDTNNAIKDKNNSATESMLSKLLSDPSVPATAKDAADGKEDGTAASKPVFGGFSFTQPPVVQPVTQPEKDKMAEKPAEAKAPEAKPFSSFSFGTTTGGGLFGSSLTNPPAPSKGFGFAFGQGANLPSFADVATKTTESKQADGVSTGFQGAGATLFGKPASPQAPAKSPNQKPPATPKSPGEGAADESFEPDVQFTPVVQLPEKVDLITGEEDEEVVFSQLCILYRFNTQSTEWKERGKGTLKILKKDKFSYRIVMRRDQTHKVCANHRFLPEMSLSTLSSAKNSYKWQALDFADGEADQCLLAVRFKTAELAKEFHEAFTKALQEINQAQENKASEEVETLAAAETAKKDEKPPDETPKSGAKAEAEKPRSVSFETPASSDKTSSSQQPSLSELFKPKEGEWNCDACYVKNPGTTNSCLACQTSKPGTSGDTKEAEQSQATTQKFVFGAPAAQSDDDVVIVEVELPSEDLQRKAAQFMLPPSFYLYETRPPCKGCIGCDPDSFDFDSIGRLKAPEDSIVKSTSQPTGDRGNVGYAKELLKGTENKEDVIQPSAAFVTGDRGNVHYSKELEQKPKDKPADEDEGPSFLSASSTKNTIDFAAVAQQGGQASFLKALDKPVEWAGKGTQLFGRVKAAGSDDEGDENPEHEADVHFKPLVSLPEVEVSTGEENEDALFCHRAKLYRFDNGEWKERGVGELKILKHKDTGKCRIILRRDQVFKLACNHYISAEMSLKPMSGRDTTWIWVAHDFADMDKEGSVVQLAARFKTKEIAKQYSTCFEQCRSSSNLVSAASPARAPGDGAPADEAPVQAPAQPPVQATDEPSEASQASAGAAAETGEEAAAGQEGEYEDMELMRKQVTLFHVQGQTAQKVCTGEFVVMLCEEVNSYQVYMEQKDETPVLHHVICKSYSLSKSKKKKYVEWTAKDYADPEDPVKKHIRIQFSSDNAVEEFAAHFAEAVQYAEEDELDEDDPRIMMEITGSAGSDDMGAVMFRAPITMAYLDKNQEEEQGKGMLYMCEDDDVGGLRIRVTDDTEEKQRLCNHIICRNYTLEKSSQSLFAKWSAIDFSTDEPIRHHFKVTFQNMDDLQRFADHFVEGVQMAKESMIDEV